MLIIPWRVGILAALLVWLLPAISEAAAIQRFTDSRGVIHISNSKPALPAASPATAPPAASESEAQSKPDKPETKVSPVAALEESSIEIRNGTRTKNLAHFTRSLVLQEGFNVAEIGNHIDFGAQATVIYYLAGYEPAARALQTKIFPWAKLEEISRLKNGVNIKVLLGSDLLEQPRMLALLSEGDFIPATPRNEAIALGPKIQIRIEGKAPAATPEASQEPPASSVQPGPATPGERSEVARSEAPPAADTTPESVPAAVDSGSTAVETAPTAAEAEVQSEQAAAAAQRTIETSLAAAMGVPEKLPGAVLEATVAPEVCLCQYVLPGAGAAGGQYPALSGLPGRLAHLQRAGDG